MRTLALTTGNESRPSAQTSNVTTTSRLLGTSFLEIPTDLDIHLHQPLNIYILFMSPIIYPPTDTSPSSILQLSIHPSDPLPSTLAQSEVPMA